MPNIQSAKKRMRQNEKSRTANRQKKAAIRTFEKKIRSLTAENKMEEAQKALRTYSSLIDKASKRNIVHPNNASRKISRLARLFRPSTATPSEAVAQPEVVAETVTQEPAETTETTTE
ncbi:MAG: 30S ribosomal protein S20 [Leptospirales bacterium]